MNVEQEICEAPKRYTPLGAELIELIIMEYTYK
jgi:hypothetical protein